mgnify:CR=1 FL=1
MPAAEGSNGFSIGDAVVGNHRSNFAGRGSEQFEELVLVQPGIALHEAIGVEDVNHLVGIRDQGMHMPERMPGARPVTSLLLQFALRRDQTAGEVYNVADEDPLPLGDRIAETFRAAKDAPS